VATSKIQILIEADDKASAKLKALAAGMEDVGKKGTKSAFNIKDAMKGVTAALGAAGIAAAVFKKAMDFAQQGAQLQRLESAGDKMADSFGQNMDDLVESIQRATNGAIPEFEAMGLANRALLLGVAETPEQFTKLATAAAALGQAMGRTSSEAMTDIVTGIGRMSPLILDNLGIMTRGGKVFDEYAASVGKTADQLTDTERKQVLLNAALQSAAPLLSRDGKLVADNATSWEILSATMKDATDNAKIWLADGLTPILSGFIAVNAAADEQTMRLVEGAATFEEYELAMRGSSAGMQIFGDWLNKAEFAAMKLELQARGVQDGWGAALFNITRAAAAVRELPVGVVNFTYKVETVLDEEARKLLGLGEIQGGGMLPSMRAGLDNMAAAQQEVHDRALETQAATEETTDLSGHVLQDMRNTAIEAAAIPVAAGEKGAWGAARTVVAEFGGDIDAVYKKIKLAVDLLRQLQGGGGGGSVDSGTGGGAQAGFQHGANFIVPPGFPNDSFPMRVSSGERVVVIPQNTQTDNRTFNFSAFGADGGEDMLEKFQQRARRS
jgi:hypothetical protein